MSLKFQLLLCVCFSHRSKKETARRCGRFEFYGFMIQKKCSKSLHGPKNVLSSRHMRPGVRLCARNVSLETINLLYANIALPFCLAKRLSLEREDNRKIFSKIIPNFIECLVPRFIEILNSAVLFMLLLEGSPRVSIMFVRAICIDNSSRAHPESVLCVIKRSCDFRWHWLGSCDDFGTKNGHLLFKRTVNWRTNIKAITKTFSRAICLRCSHWKNYNEQRNKYFYHPGALFGQKSPSGRHLILEATKKQPHSWKPLRFSIAQSISHFWRAWQVWREVFRVR